MSSEAVLPLIDAHRHDAVISDMDGVDADELGLPGKPDPAVRREAASRLGSVANRTVVVEDVEAGVAAGRNGEFVLVVGIDRKNRRRPVGQTSGRDTNHPAGPPPK